LINIIINRNIKFLFFFFFFFFFFNIKLIIIINFYDFIGKITNVQVILRPVDLLDTQSKYPLPIIKPLKRYVENEMEGMNQEIETPYIGYSNVSNDIIS